MVGTLLLAACGGGSEGSSGTGGDGRNDRCSTGRYDRCDCRTGPNHHRSDLDRRRIDVSGNGGFVVGVDYDRCSGGRAG